MIASFGDPDPPEPYNFSGCNNYKNAQNNSFSSIISYSNKKIEFCNILFLGDILFSQNREPKKTTNVFCGSKLCGYVCGYVSFSLGTRSETLSKVRYTVWIHIRNLFCIIRDPDPMIQDPHY